MTSLLPVERSAAAVLVALLVPAIVAYPGRTSAQSSTKAPAESTSASPARSNFGANVTELKIIDRTQGTGAEAVAGKAVVVHYTGWLYDPAAPDGHGAK